MFWKWRSVGDHADVICNVQVAVSPHVNLVTNEVMRSVQQDMERIDLVREALIRAGLDGVVCGLPQHVLMLSGYFPVVGSSLAIATRTGKVGLIIPKDEKRLSDCGWADHVETFEPGTLKKLASAVSEAMEPLKKMCRKFGLTQGSIGLETGPTFEPASYVAGHSYLGALRHILAEAVPNVALSSAHNALTQLRAVLTTSERERLRLACKVAQRAFEHGAQQIRPGQTETEIADLFTAPLRIEGMKEKGVRRAGGEAFCMSGPNSAEASGAFAQSRSRTVMCGDMLLIHCNSHVDGYWTDITRTYVLGEPTRRQRRIYEAIFAARTAALAAIQTGVTGAQVDDAARSVLSLRGFKKEFRHALGHGVGLASINHNARPRLHPKSRDRLRPGMVFNVEPAVYISGFGGARHCDVVAVTQTGAELLTPFFTNPKELWLSTI
jgi:Xaa-Pro aminopeptidase